MKEKEIVSAVTALLAFLVPLGIYCVLLAYVNRRNKPLMVRGTWDAICLLGAISGLLLWTMPALLNEFCRQAVDAVEAPYLYSELWIVYFVFLAFFAALMVYLRAAKTMIYNVDTSVLLTVFQQAVAKVGMTANADRGRLRLTPAKVEAGSEHAFTEKPLDPAPAANDRRFADLTVENFAPMCHVTLHWHHCEPYLRRQIEEELECGLELAAPEENIAASWFYTISGLIFGALLMVAAMILMQIFFPRH